MSLTTILNGRFILNRRVGVFCVFRLVLGVFMASSENTSLAQCREVRNVLLMERRPRFDLFASVSGGRVSIKVKTTGTRESDFTFLGSL